MNTLKRLFLMAVPAAILLFAASAPCAGPLAGSPISVLAAFEEAWADGRADLIEETLASDKIDDESSLAGRDAKVT